MSCWYRSKRGIGCVLDIATQVLDIACVLNLCYIPVHSHYKNIVYHRDAGTRVLGIGCVLLHTQQKILCVDWVSEHKYWVSFGYRYTCIGYRLGVGTLTKKDIVYRLGRKRYVPSGIKKLLHVYRYTFLLWYTCIGTRAAPHWVSVPVYRHQAGTRYTTGTRYTYRFCRPLPLTDRKEERER